MGKWSQSKSVTQITVNGRTYAGVEEMPADVRREYERAMGQLLVDRDGNGVPDVFERPPGEGSSLNEITVVSQHSVVKTLGREEFEDLPAEARAAILNSIQPSGSSSRSPGRRLVSVEVTPRRRRESVRVSWLLVIAVVAGVVLALRLLLRSLQP